MRRELLTVVLDQHLLAELMVSPAMVSREMREPTTQFSSSPPVALAQLSKDPLALP